MYCEKRQNGDNGVCSSAVPAPPLHFRLLIHDGPASCGAHLAYSFSEYCLSTSFARLP
jgi:hypothetical protein